MAYADGRIAWAPVRCVAVYSHPLAQPPEEAYGQTQGREAAALTEHVAPVQRRRCACAAEAQAAIAE